MASAEPGSSRAAPRKLTGRKDEIDAFIDQFDTFLFDCDGVLWQGSKLMPRVVETLEMLRSKGKKLIFVTNNSTKSRAAYSEKFTSFGIPVSVDEIFGSAYSTAVCLARVLQIPKDKRVFVIGEAGIEEELTAEGIQHFGGTQPLWFPEDEVAEHAGPDPSVSAVVVGLDRHISYAKLALAFGYLQDPNVHFFATNVDSTFPTHGKLLPGAGSCSAPLTYMLGGRAPTAFGKPSPAMMESIERRYKLDKSRACMVGDRLNTDIKFGIEGGLKGTLAVLTGVSTEREILEAGEASEGPDVYLDCLGDLLG
ncbi:4-nitrophenylphosphatase [Drechslerella dactyloides]|uniref:4-nitrophenylphosphatase n=1 Tax=Drechslerella dactyloides TaxID=74499 RepID=A0AAD6IYA5_DREDA|nr:4-nitrophenylphosphatase [Drechslerella dactyloides]